jgi:transcriptional regulator with XRE-family HTH domain
VRGYFYTLILAACLPDIIQKGKTDMQNSNNYYNGLEDVLKESGRAASELKRLPGSFSETLNELMKKRKLSRARLSIESNLSESTISRMKASDNNNFTKQVVIAVCIGLRLSPAEAFSLIDKSSCKLVMTNEQDVAYFHVLSSCGQYPIEDVNEMLRINGYEELGGK